MEAKCMGSCPWRICGSWKQHEATFIIKSYEKGLEHALLERVPFAEHRNCARHLYANWKKKFNGHYYKSLFWKAVRYVEESELNRVLEEMTADSPQAHQAFISIGLKKFCQAYISTNCKSDNDQQYIRDIQWLHIKCKKKTNC
ncbi:hypothetical protein Cni_G06677 [Canna indica]|uniref:Uncharacterized protein n=1 Tax=Canna indica TaxID=4628 RepID=A0AAQ3JX23_9LILI|nr:hypothetical protein Cni_G06677 [Canna indica]